MAIVFKDEFQQSISKRQRADLYMRIYQFAGEDFLTRPDAHEYSLRVKKWMTDINKRLMKCKFPNKISKYESISPVEPYKNTTKTQPNMNGNYIVSQKGLAGDLYMVENRRQLVIPILLKPQIPPVLKETTRVGLPNFNQSSFGF